MMDCHTHWCPDWQGSSPTDPRPWLDVLDRHGITRAVVLPTRGLMDDTLLELDNEEIIACATHSHGRMIPFCTVNLSQGERALQELDRCIGLGVRGIKFHPWLQASSANHPMMDDVCEKAAAAGIPILLHDGTPPMSLPSQIGLAARRHPRTTFILGHCGLLEFWREAIMVLNRCGNVWGCLCSPHPGAMREVFHRGPKDRLCWGSDFGFGMYDLIGYRLGLLECAIPSASDRAVLLADNPARLFPLNATDHAVLR